MRESRSVIQPWLRWSRFLLGFLILLWLPVEESNLTFVALFALAICFLGTISIAKKQEIPSRKYAWAGFLGGVCVGLVGFMLMVFKVGLHNHAVPDFTISQLLRWINAAPVWAISGLLLGYGIHLYDVAKEY